MKADETRKKLIKELNAQFEESADSIVHEEEREDLMKYFSLKMFDKPKLFEPKATESIQVKPNTLDIQSVKGIGFKSNEDSNWINNKQQEIYDMKALIQSNPENMQTFSYDTKVVKAQLSLVKKKDWYDILFEDIDWFKKIDFPLGKRIFKI